MKMMQMICRMAPLALLLSACWGKNPLLQTDMLGEADMTQVCKLVTDTPKQGEILVPCGTFLQGSKMNAPLDPDAQLDEMPATEEFVQAFYMDQTEVTVLAYQGCVEAGNLDMGTGCAP